MTLWSLVGGRGPEFLGQFAFVHGLQVRDVLSVRVADVLEVKW